MLESHCFKSSLKPGQLNTTHSSTEWWPAWMKIHWNRIWLRAHDHTTLEGLWPHYMILEVCWGGLWTLSFRALTISWSRLLARVWSGRRPVGLGKHYASLHQNLGDFAPKSPKIPRFAALLRYRDRLNCLVLGRESDEDYSPLDSTILTNTKWRVRYQWWSPRNRVFGVELDRFSVFGLRLMVVAPICGHFQLHGQLWRWMGLEIVTSSEQMEIAKLWFQASEIVLGWKSYKGSMWKIFLSL